MNNSKELQIAAIIDNYNKVEEEVNSRREYRMKNYYDCIDDYSWGGPCDKADNMLLNREARKRDILIEEVNNDGYHFESTANFRLKKDGNIVAVGIHYNPWGGSFFKTHDCNVGLPKRLVTLTKKGYVLEFYTRTYKCKFLRITDNGNVKNSYMEIVEENITEWKDPIIDINLGREKQYSDYYYYYNFENK